MRFVLLYHSLVSDWNHGNAHFLRGIVRELRRRGVEVEVLEPANGWSRRNLVEDRGPGAVREFARAFPDLRSRLYTPSTLDLDRAFEGADLVLVHEWTDPELVRRIGRYRRQNGGDGLRVLFHDTHHRAVSRPDELARMGIDLYDGALVFGEALREVYLARGWVENALTWHEAADTTVFFPREPGAEPSRDLVWVGNWGDDERADELQRFLLEPVRALGLRADVFGIRYPREALDRLERAGLAYRGFIQNHRVPEVFARFEVTVHVPRRQYVELLPGIPTIRVFEALACGIPLVCSPWADSEGLFRPGTDFLVARDGEEMTEMLRAVVRDPALSERLGRSGLERIAARHTCGHRADELLELCARIGVRGAAGLRGVASGTEVPS